MESFDDWNEGAAGGGAPAMSTSSDPTGGKDPTGKKLQAIIKQRTDPNDPFYTGATRARPPSGSRATEEQMRIDKAMEPYNALPGWKKPVSDVRDAANIALDDLTFGFYDKAIGPEAQARTQEARDRLGWAGTGVDVGTMALGVPKVVGGLLPKAPGWINSGLRAFGYGAEGAVIGGAEAAGHDRDIASGALTGGAAGGGGSAIGDFLGKIFGRSIAQARQEYPTNEALVTAADKAKGKSKATTLLKDRARRVEEASKAVGIGGKTGLATYSEGIDAAGRKATGHTYPETEAIRRAANRPAPIADAIQHMGETISGANINPWARYAGWLLSAGALPVTGGALSGSARAGRAALDKMAMEDMFATLRNPAKQGLQQDSAAFRASMRDRLARGMIGGSIGD